MYWALGEDEESQKKGLIGIVCWPSASEALSPDKFAIVYSPRDVPRHIHLSKRMFDCSPIRIAGIHMCSPDKPIYHMIRSGLALSMGDSRSRLKFHCGTFFFIGIVVVVVVVFKYTFLLKIFGKITVKYLSHYFLYHNNFLFVYGLGSCRR